MPLCNTSPKPTETRSSGLGPCLSAGYHQSALWQDLTWITAAGWNPTGKFSLYFGKGKHGPEGCGSCRQGCACQLDHLCSSDRAHIAFLWVLLLPELHPAFLSSWTWLVYLFSFVLSWGLCTSSVPNEQCQDFNWSSFCWQDDPFAQRNSPTKPDKRSLSFFSSFSLHVLLPKKGMTLIKKCMLSIKIGMCLSPIACYHSETYSSSVSHFKAAWILQGSFIDFTGFGTSWPWCCMWKWWSPELWRVMLWVSSPFFQNQLYLSACVLLDDHSFSYQILLSMTSAWARRLGKTQIPGSLIS